MADRPAEIGATDVFFGGIEGLCEIDAYAESPQKMIQVYSLVLWDGLYSLFADK